MYEITIRVPESVENNINTEIQLKSKTPGSINVPLRVVYDNNDRSIPSSHEDFQRPTSKPNQVKKDSNKTKK